MRSQGVFSAALAIAVVAIAGSAVIFVSKKAGESQDALVRSTMEVSAIRSTLGEVSGKLEAVQEELDSVRRRSLSMDDLQKLEPIAANAENVLDGDALARAMSRIGELEARLAEVETKTAQPQATEDPIAALLRDIVSREPMTDERLAEHHGILGDGTRGDEERLRSLRSIRHLPDERDAHAPVVNAIVEWMQTTEDAEVREDIIRNLHGAEREELVDPLLYALRNDLSDDVREEAAETLSDYLDYQGVQQALEHARDNDESRRVREQAVESLEEAD